MRKTRIIVCLAVVCVMSVANLVSADNIQGIIAMDFVSIGNAGNSADTTGYGAVGYNYRIGKYEVTNAQWNAFTAAAGAPTGNPPVYTGTQQPTNNISWYEAAQFCNYLTSGDKSLGAYQLGTNGSITVNRASAVSTYGIVYVLPTENEWYKAAYYKPNTGGYSLYANGKNTAPSTSQARYSSSSPWNVGAGTQEQNGTYDMMGNVLEWNETLLGSGPGRCLRGGSFGGASGSGASKYLASRYLYDFYPSIEYNDIGFRVASVPEPTTMLLLGLGGIFLRKSCR